MTATPRTASANDSNRHMLRHSLATVAYRGSKAMRGATEDFSSFRAPNSCRTPAEASRPPRRSFRLVAHPGAGRAQVAGIPGPSLGPRQSPLLRIPESLRRLPRLRRAAAILRRENFPGPIADALTHIGQIAILRRIAGIPTRGENLVVAEITEGRVGEDQPPPRREF